jgi:hypothetical protein
MRVCEGGVGLFRGATGDGCLVGVDFIGERDRQAAGIACANRSGVEDEPMEALAKRAKHLAEHTGQGRNGAIERRWNIIAGKQPQRRPATIGGFQGVDGIERRCAGG